ncbi:MAG: ATP-binding response regulator, partial [Phormidesmis sp.]
QVFGNALANAIKFTPRDGQITTRLTYSVDQAQVQITDTGRGIDADFLPHVFDRFRQANSSSAREYGGLGIGLTIVKTFVEAHNGTVRISSPGIGLGTTLTVVLPLTAAIAPVQTAVPLPPGDDLLSGLRILIVEDDADNREILTIVLEEQAGTVIPASSVAAAIEQLTDEETPDLLISDINLPGRDGFELIDWVRSRAPEQGGDLPAIALTGYAGSEHTESTLKAGFQAHLVKPINTDELMVTIVNLV